MTLMATTKSKISNLLSILTATHITPSLASASYSNGPARKFRVDRFGGSGRSLSSSVAPLESDMVSLKDYEKYRKALYGGITHNTRLSWLMLLALLFSPLSPWPRYDELWMPLISDLTVGSTSTHHPPMILPPIDIQWVWFCHTFNPVFYRQYCDSRFSKIIAKLFSTKRMKSALNRCRDIWIYRYPSEQFFVVHKRYVKRLRRKLRFEEKRNSNQRRARIMYYWFKQFKDGPNSEMGGFTRILHSGKPDSFMDEIPTFVAQPLPAGTDQIYRQIGEKYGVQYSETEILNRYRRAYEQPWGRSRLRYVNDGRPFWQYIVSSSTGCSDSQYFDQLYNYYTTEKAWHLCDPDAEKVFKTLRNAGVKLAVVSNFDTRLRPVLRALNCDYWFDAVAVSAEVEAEKPNPTIFIKACELLGVKPEDAIHVGDDHRNDVWGARDAGCDA